jgi:hypothetical protein
MLTPHPLRAPRPASLVRRAALVALSLGAAGCGGEEPTGSTGAPGPSIGPAELIVPFASPPAGVVTQDANNNLDVVRHEGRVYLGFRTAPTHFASEKTEIYVVSSADQKSWELEARFAVQTDLREPRFLAFDGQLFLYLSKLGKDPLKFEPQGVMVSKFEAPGKWSEPTLSTYDPGFLVWRTRTIADTPYVVGYVENGGLYSMSGKPITIHFLTTNDGVALAPVVPGKAVVEEGGGSETDFALQDDGSLIAVTRNEAGDALGWGSKICRAEASDLGTWSCRIDQRKYDSPLVFRHGARTFLIARRQLAHDGKYDLERRDLSHKDQTGAYLIEYSFTPKRCSLWEVDAKKQEVSFVLDFPSMGDTCFPGILDEGGGKYAVYNYSSPLEFLEQGEDWKWIEGQSRPTNIYRVELTLP